MPDLASVFSDLKALMSPYAARLDVKADSDTELYLDTRHRQKNGRALFFGAVQLKKTFVSFHLMPVYVQPALLEGISPALKKRMQGKSCFNFSAVDEALFRELAALTRAGFASYEEQGFA